MALAGSEPGVGIVGAAAGFLVWTARGWIFMGDVGSTTLGVLLAAMVLRLSHDGVPFIAAVLPLLPFLFDTAVTLTRRIVRGERFFSAHRSHFYQWLVASGWSHLAVTALWGALAVVCSFAALRDRVMSDGAKVTTLVLLVALHVSVAVWITRRHRRVVARRS